MRIQEYGDFGNLEKYLKKSRRANLDVLGQAIVNALRDTTPVESGETANAWGYKIVSTSRGLDLEIYNTHINDGVNIAIILHYGHGTGTGGYVPPRPYIDSAIDAAYKKTINKVLEDYLK